MVYGENPAKNSMQGKDYERAVICHGLTAPALKIILLEHVEPEDRFVVIRVQLKIISSSY